MAQVVRNPDNTLTVTLSVWEQRVLIRWAQEQNRTPAKQFEDTVNGFLLNKRSDYRTTEGATRQALHDALSPAKQAEVDAIYATVTPEGPQT